MIQQIFREDPHRGLIILQGPDQIENGEIQITSRYVKTNWVGDTPSTFLKTFRNGGFTQ